jgi:hypothetical protein
MDDVKEKGINPVSPLGEGEPEPTPAPGAAAYPGYDRPVGRKFHRFPKVVPPSVGRLGSSTLIPFPGPLERRIRRAKDNSSDSTS